ncbi:hypothetical protein [Robertmurraya massiliosenegalensis]|uniref:hypothetical protein n=1 Tax=Robertmurraya massiliosenegalensis TaxID=1287657 RepID=UPI00030764FC|nr:hypothetical protein [Robertmurraya massiliosenegalensis]
MDNQEYTLSEAAKRLAELKGKKEPYTRQYMHKLVKEGKLKCRKLGQDSPIYVTTEYEIQSLIKKINRVGRPTKNS